MARDRALAMVSSSRAMWQRCASRSGFFGLGGGGFEGTGEPAVLDELLSLVSIGGRAGAGRLLEGRGCRAATGMLLGLAVGAGGPGGGGAGRRRGIERGGGGRGGGHRDLLFSLILSRCGSLLWLLVKGFDASAFSTSDFPAADGSSSSEQR